LFMDDLPGDILPLRDVIPSSAALEELDLLWEHLFSLDRQDILFGYALGRAQRRRTHRFDFSIEGGIFLYTMAQDYRQNASGASNGHYSPEDHPVRKAIPQLARALQIRRGKRFDPECILQLTDPVLDDLHQDPELAGLFESYLRTRDQFRETLNNLPQSSRSRPVYHTFLTSIQILDGAYQLYRMTHGAMPADIR